MRNWNGLHAVTREDYSGFVGRPAARRSVAAFLLSSASMFKHVELHAVRAAFGWTRVYAISIEERRQPPSSRASAEVSKVRPRAFTCMRASQMTEPKSSTRRRGRSANPELERTRTGRHSRRTRKPYAFVQNAGKSCTPAGDHGSSQNLDDPSPHGINTSPDANLVDERHVGSFVPHLCFLSHCIPSLPRDRSDVAS